MDKNMEDRVLDVYDELLSSFEHVKNLSIDFEIFHNTVKRILPSNIVIDEAIDKAHNSFISEIIFSSLSKNMAETKSYITYPDFSVKTYFDNLSFLYKNTFTLEKSLFIAKLSEINFIIEDENLKRDKDRKKINVVTFKRLSLAPDVDVIKVTFNVINTILFYEYYSKHLNSFKVNRIRPNQDDLKYLKSLAIRDALIKMEEWDIDLSESFIINSYNYEEFKRQIKLKYHLEIKDKFVSGNGGVVVNWLDCGVVKLDNRPLTIVGKKTEIIPLKFQRSLKNRRN